MRIEGRPRSRVFPSRVLIVATSSRLHSVTVAPSSALLPATAGLHGGASAKTNESLYLAVAAIGPLDGGIEASAAPYKYVLYHDHFVLLW